MTTDRNPATASGPPTPRVVTTRAELRAVLGARAASGPGTAPRRRAVVMTMGALHAGHLELVRRARAEVGPDGEVVVTDFVNPLQFGPGEDYERYPRDVEGDVALLASAGPDARVDVVLAPSVEEMYPGYGDGAGPIVRVTSGRIGTVLEGASRPGHFDGVLTVVLKLLHVVQPDVAVFGAKDAQQLLAVRRMVDDLDLDVEVLAVPTVRETDGLARSSRNAYLTPEQREQALALSRALRAGADAAAAGGDAAGVLAAARGILDGAPGVVTDYLVLVDPATVEDLAPGAVGPGLLLVAARVGTTRLIDNTAVRIAPAGQDGTDRARLSGGTA